MRYKGSQQNQHREHRFRKWPIGFGAENLGRQKKNVSTPRPNSYKLSCFYIKSIAMKWLVSSPEVALSTALQR